MNICIFGASITWGAWDREKDGWVNRLRLFLESTLDYDVRVYNASIGGDDSDDLLERFETEAEARNPDIIVFAIGTNDSLYIKSKDNPATTLEKFESNLSKLSKQAKKYTQRIIFVGLTKVNELKTKPAVFAADKDVYYDNENIAKYNYVIQSFCQANKLLFIKMIDLLDNEDLEDGLHPNAQGHEKMFQKVRDFLLEHKIVEK